MEQAEERLLDTLAYLQGFLGCVVLVLLQVLSSGYGRYSSSSRLHVPARAAWAVQELPALALPLYQCALAPAPRLQSWPNCILLAMYLVHYVQRTLIYPFLIRGGKPMPLYSSVLAFMFCTYNGYLQSRYLSQYAVYTDAWVTDPRFLVGFVLWLMGMLINIHSDHILRNLRKPGETGYRIPTGGLFEYVSAANYFGEIIEWCGYALASWSIQGGAFALCTFCFLLGRAKEHHTWYHKRFEDYPKFRKIIIPFLF
ncbi:3-oxo-5-alpha-steroid 4-dehydrogenase 1 [Carlito syrichta]|uniref:3-oxo-5-alpha-steroid 4-dehydrogenase n=1 Tax=Carlito syrichta TaxID=1868482 RepID=A0A1U7T9K6_CARSF|nr:3-oxo-5-alpha-steroid 4-dehydrogenase 1 [Carlito syrichta]